MRFATTMAALKTFPCLVFEPNRQRSRSDKTPVPLYMIKLRTVKLKTSREGEGVSCDSRVTYCLQLCPKSLHSHYTYLKK